MSMKRGCSFMTSMHIVALQAISGAESGNALPQYALFASQLFGLALPGSNLNQKAFNQGRDRCVLFGGFHARSPVSLIVECYCDIFHVFTISQDSKISNSIEERGLNSARASHPSGNIAVLTAAKNGSARPDRAWPAGMLAGNGGSGWARSIIDVSTPKSSLPRRRVGRIEHSYTFRREIRQITGYHSEPAFEGCGHDL